MRILSIHVAVGVFLLSATPLSGQRPSPSTGKIVGALVEQVGRQMPLSEWRRLQPDDSVEWNGSRDGVSWNDEWCALARGARENGFSSEALFYAPQAPRTLALPPVSPRLSGSCQLGQVTLWRGNADSLAIVGLWRADSSAITAVLGPVAAGSDPSGLRWRRRDVRVMESKSVDTAGHRRRFTEQLLLAMPPSPMLLTTDERIASEDYFDVPAIGVLPIDSLIQLAALRADEREAVRRFMKATPREDSIANWVDSTRDSTFANMLKHLVRPAPPVTPDQRIARLLIGDWFIDATASRMVYWDTNANVRRQLTNLGPRMDEDHLDGWMQDHFWLAEALAVGGTGSAGRAAFLEAMSMGFEFASACGRGHQIDDVIERGTVYLQNHPGSPIRGKVELLLAEAYRDAVALASGAAYGGDATVVAQYRPRLVQNRQAAIAHFRGAFGVLVDSPRARYDWQDAWRLVAGLAPRHTTFYCVYD